MASTKEFKIGNDLLRVKLIYRDMMSDQGVCLQIHGEVDGHETEILRFDCFDYAPHYHYDPSGENHRLMIDLTTEGDPLEWTIIQLNLRLDDMIRRAGFDEIADKAEKLDLTSEVDMVALEARNIALSGRSTVFHDRGDVIVDAGPIKFGVEYRNLKSDEGVAIHVLGDHDGKEIELLTFDCFKNAPHYHYGPRSKNQRLYLDKTVVPDPLGWAINLFKGGNVGPMLARAGYGEHVAKLNPSLLLKSVLEVESVGREMERVSGN